MQIMQGDQYTIGVIIKDDAGNVISEADEVMITLGNISRGISDGVHYDNGEWIFPVTQADTFSLPEVSKLQVRVKFSDGAVGGASVGTVFVVPSANKEVL